MECIVAREVVNQLSWLLLIYFLSIHLSFLAVVADLFNPFRPFKQTLSMQLLMTKNARCL